MGYKRGQDILPANLLRQLQEYIQGELIYIPKAEKSRAGWGELSGAREDIRQRNNNICEQYHSGMSVAQLVCMYHLSEDSIRKIIHKNKQCIGAIH